MWEILTLKVNDILSSVAAVMDSSNYNSGSDFCSARRVWDPNMTYTELYCGYIQIVSIFLNKWSLPKLGLQAKFSTGTWNLYDIPNTVQSAVIFICQCCCVMNCHRKHKLLWRIMLLLLFHRHCYVLWRSKFIECIK